jgi:DNA primase
MNREARPDFLYNSSMSSIDEVKARIDIVDLVSESVTLRHSGKNYVGFCPFHPNSRTPAFVVFPDSGTWRCFGQCNEGGDIFKFVMKKEGCDFPQALQTLADKAGVVLQPLNSSQQAEAEEYEHLRSLLEEAVTFYQFHMRETPRGKFAQAYLEKRGITAATIETFGLGYAPDSWDAALSHFIKKGYTQENLSQVGLITEREDKHVYDRFRDRITIPIRDAAGKIAGFGARILNPEDQPKFLNSPQTVLFDKGRLLYGLDRARKSIRAEDQVVIVEGYLDVIALHQQGFNNAVSPMGTALTEDQLRLLKRFTRRIVLALDADAAGHKATLRGLEVARQAMDHTTEITFDPHGLLRHEGRLQADLRVTTIPEGLDPDDVALRDPAEWARIVASAQPIVVHVMETLAAGQNIDDAKVKSQIAAQVLPLINEVGNSIERDDYRQRLARLLKVDERSLYGVQTGGKPSTRPARRKPSVQAEEKQQIGLAPSAHPARGLETHILQLLLRQPEVLYNLDRMLQKAGLLRFSPQDFEQVDHQMIARLICDSLEQDRMEASQYLAENTPETLDETIHAYLVPFAEGEPTSQTAFELLFRTLLRLRESRVKENLEQMRFLSQELQGQNDLRGNIDEMTVQYTLSLNRLMRAIKQPITFD